MSELTDLNATGNGLSAINGGLQGLLEAYKMKMAQNVEQAKISQQGLDSGANARAMAGYRSSMIDAKDAALLEKIREFNVGGGAATAAPVVSPDGKFIQEKGKWVPVPQPAALAGAAAKTSDAIKSAAGAYNAMDESLAFAKDFAPQTSGLAAAAMSPLTFLKSHLSPTSPENNMRDKMGQAGTFYATAVNKAGGGRMTETEVQNMAKSMGESGVGDTYQNLANKHAQMKEDLAIKIGVPRAQIEDYLAQMRPAPLVPPAPAIPPVIAKLLPGAAPAPAAPVAPAAAPAPVAGKYAHLSDAELAAMAQGQ